jgi:hypothetical protein
MYPRNDRALCVGYLIVHGGHSRCSRPNSTSPRKPASTHRWSRAPRCSASAGAWSGSAPGPALENLATLSPKVIVFCIAMVAGMIAHDGRYAKRPAAPPSGALAGADG